MCRWLADVFSGKWHLRWLVFRFLQDFSGCEKSLNICLFTRIAEEFKNTEGQQVSHVLWNIPTFAIWYGKNELLLASSMYVNLPSLSAYKHHFWSCLQGMQNCLLSNESLQKGKWLNNSAVCQIRFDQLDSPSAMTYDIF